MYKKSNGLQRFVYCKHTAVSQSNPEKKLKNGEK